MPSDNPACQYPTQNHKGPAFVSICHIRPGSSTEDGAKREKFRFAVTTIHIPTRHTGQVIVPSRPIFSPHSITSWHRRSAPLKSQVHCRPAVQQEGQTSENHFCRPSFPLLQDAEERADCRHAGLVMWQYHEIVGEFASQR